VEAIIDVQHLSKSFGALRAVDDLSFSVPKGSLFAFLGQNGAGKTTTISMLIGLLRKDSGQILYDGDENFGAFKSKIGAVFQNNVLDDQLTVEENLLLYGALYLKGQKEIRARYEELVSALHLEGVIKKRVRTLSGGQKRKMEIARGLWNRPSILFLDEPTTGLDPKTRLEVWDILRMIQHESGMTVFLTTHYMEETADADQVVIIHKGRLVAHGSPAELKSRYSHDRLVVVPVDDHAFEDSLRHEGLDFATVADTYVLQMDDVRRSIELLGKWKDNIRSYELVKGSMDDVFLAATGETIGKDAQ
jgi:multidrug/hemolysin transport system ATP-binding protein